MAMVPITIFVQVGQERFYCEVEMPERKAHDFASLLETNRHAETVTMALEDEAGAKLGVIGTVYDSEA